MIADVLSQRNPFPCNRARGSITIGAVARPNLDPEGAVSARVVFLAAPGDLARLERLAAAYERRGRRPSRSAVLRRALEVAETLEAALSMMRAGSGTDGYQPSETRWAGR
jgi:hypothetical protein